MQDTLNPWLQVLSELQKKIDQNSFETWFEPTVFIGQEGDSLYIKVPNSYFKDWLSFHYSALINEAGQKLFGRVFDIKYIFDDASFSFKRNSPEERRSKSGSLLNPNLNPNYTFDPVNFPELDDKQKGYGKLIVPAGPNNPASATL